MKTSKHTEARSTNEKPLVITVFGGTGDLAQKKLYPALFHLFENDLLPDDFQVFAVARSAYTDQEYQQMVHDSLQNELDDPGKQVQKSFCSHFRYIQGNVKNTQSYVAIDEEIAKLEEHYGRHINRMFYLAVSPRFYSTIFEKMNETKLGDEEGDYWIRLLVEKPFGSDLQSARELDTKLQDIFEERQIFRIDHYLAKTAVQNLIAFRFSNFLFEGSWNKESIKQVHVRMHEDFGIEDRGSFYDSVGALRDVGQNHVLQMLALTTMEGPKRFNAQAIRDARAEALASLRTYTDHEDISNHVVRAQYDGYTDIDSVADASTTETFFQIRAFVENDRWEGVPFYLESGKELTTNTVEVEVIFKEVLPCVCGAEEPHGHENVVTLQMKPDQSIDVRFWAREPGMQYALAEEHMHFSYSDETSERMPDAYEKILYDSIIGDQTLFARSDEVMASWEFITPIITNWEETELHTYETGADPAGLSFTTADSKTAN